jgi:hypothetical protein
LQTGHIKPSPRLSPFFEGEEGGEGGGESEVGSRGRLVNSSGRDTLETGGEPDGDDMIPVGGGGVGRQCGEQVCQIEAYEFIAVCKKVI